MNVDRSHLSDQQLRRLHILAAARVCFANSGFHSASMTQICAEARMSPGALYRYFPSKDAMIEAIAEEERLQAASCMSALNGEGSLVDRITAVGLDYLRQTQDPATGGLMLEIWSESIRNTAVGQRFSEIDNEVRTAFEGVLIEARNKGEIAASVDIAMTLTFLFALADGLVMRLQVEGDLTVDSIAPYFRKILAALLVAEERDPQIVDLIASQPEAEPIVGRS